MRNVEMLTQQIERWEDREEDEGMPLPPHLGLDVNRAIDDINAYIQHLTLLRGKAQGILERCRNHCHEDTETPSPH